MMVPFYNQYKFQTSIEFTIIREEYGPIFVANLVVSFTTDAHKGQQAQGSHLQHLYSNGYKFELVVFIYKQLCNQHRTRINQKVKTSSQNEYPKKLLHLTLKFIVSQNTAYSETYSNQQMKDNYNKSQHRIVGVKHIYISLHNFGKRSNYECEHSQKCNWLQIFTNRNIKLIIVCFDMSKCPSKSHEQKNRLSGKMSQEMQYKIENIKYYQTLPIIRVYDQMNSSPKYTSNVYYYCNVYNHMWIIDLLAFSNHLQLLVVLEQLQHRFTRKHHSENEQKDVAVHQLLSSTKMGSS